MRSTFLRRLLVVIIGLIPLAGIVTSIAAPSVASAGGTPPPQAIFQGQPGCNTTQYSYPGHQRVVYNLVTSDVASGYVADASITKLAPQEALVYGPGSDQLTPNTTWTFVEDGINNSSPQAEIEVHIVWSGAGLPTVTKDLDAVVPLAGNCPLTPPMANPTYVGMATTNGGYWLARSDGRVVAWGTAKNYGDMYNRALNAPIVGIAATADGKGYWLLAGDGGIFSFGDAVFHGSTGNIRLNKPVVGMTTTKTGNGYWLVASDGGIFSFGDAVFYGSTGNIRLNKPVVGMSTTLSGNGYYLDATDGGIFAFGDAVFYGSMGGTPLNSPAVGMAADPSGGYWLVAGDGGIFSFGRAGFYGSAGGQNLVNPISGMASTTTGNGYWLISTAGNVYSYGDATFLGDGVQI